VSDPERPDRSDTKGFDIDSFAVSDYREWILRGTEGVRAEFEAHFGPGIENLARKAKQARDVLRDVETSLPPSERSVWVAAYLNLALDRLLTSAHFFLNGFTTHSGAARRQGLEAVAASLLFSCQTIKDYDRFREAPENFSAHKVATRLQNKKVRRALSLTDAEAEQFQEVVAFYSDDSHASIKAVAMMHSPLDPNTRTLMGSFDKAKMEGYDHEIRGVLMALLHLMSVANHCADLLAQNHAP